MPRAAAAGEAVILLDGSVSQYAQTAAAMRESLGGDAVVIDVRTGGDAVAKTRARAPRVVVAIGQQALQLAAGRLPELPLVYCTVLYPERYLRASTRATGVPMEIKPEVQLRRFRDAVPGVRRIGVIYTAAGSGPLVDQARLAADELGIEMIAKPVRKGREVGAALESILPRIDALWLVPDPEVISKDIFAYLLAETMDRGIPVFGFLEGFTQAGALASISPDYTEIGRLGAALVDRILRAPADAALPAPVFSEGALSLNLKTAARLRIRIPQRVRDAARMVY